MAEGGDSLATSGVFSSSSSSSFGMGREVLPETLLLASVAMNSLANIQGVLGGETLHPFATLA